MINRNQDLNSGVVENQSFAAQIQLAS